MNERQAFALSHPITDPDNPLEVAKVEKQLRSVRRHGAGWLIMSILAVDR